MALYEDLSCSAEVISAAMKVHSVLGPALFESAYEACLAHELRLRGLGVRSQVALPVIYEGMHLELAYRIDFLVEEQVVVELKTVDKLLPIHQAQLLAYLKLGGQHVGLLINFRVPRLRNGIRRVLSSA